MSRLFVDLRHGALALLLSFCSLSMQGQDALSCLIPARWSAGQAVSARALSGFQQSLLPKLTVDLSHRNIDLGLVNSPFQTSRLHLTYAIPERSGGGEAGWTGQLEDDREGESLQRLRIVGWGLQEGSIGEESFLFSRPSLGIWPENLAKQRDMGQSIPVKSRCT